MVEPGDRGVERPLGGERADVQLVDDRAGQVHTAPRDRLDGDLLEVDDLRGTLGPVGQRQGPRVGARLAVVDGERVRRPGDGVLLDLPPAALAALHRVAVVVEHERDGALGERRPHLEPHPSSWSQQSDRQVARAGRRTAAGHRRP